jgi:hypothetical protein
MTTTIKVHIKTKCKFCNGKAYLPNGKAKHCSGEIYTQYQKCSYCDESGLSPKWISLLEFIALMDKVDPMQPDYQSLAQVEPTSQYQDSLDSSGI